ncbi:SNT2 [Sanghuangporus sanghuang]
MDVRASEIVITLKNGDKVKVNDHVYCSPNWSIRDGTPYSVARIMEFLPPEDKSGFGSAGLLATSINNMTNQSNGLKVHKGKGRESIVNGMYTRVRLAWYYRPSDVSDRNVADSRLLLAAIYSEICDITQLRAKCFVIHRDKLANLAEWKRKPDRFYFHKLFDPYIKKEFEVLLSTDIRNLPSHIRDVLVSRYEYVVAEKEVVPDLTDSLRLCETCGEWCGHIDSVQCAACKKHFHMSCVNPPLVAKPSRGYGWTCAPCSRRHEDKVDSREAPGGQQGLREGTPKNGTGSNTNGANGNLARIKPRGRPRKERAGLVNANNEEELQVKHYKLWPFRYFGLYTVAEDTVDPDDLIFPRAATRVGPKFQANVPLKPGDPAPPLTGSSVTTALGTTGSGTGEIEERGGDSTIEVMSLVNEFSPKEVETLERAMQRQTVRKDQIHSVDWLTEIVRRATQAYSNGRSLESVSMKMPLRLEKWKKQETRYTDREWNDEEVAAFEDGIAQFGAELRAVREEVGTRSMPEVVRFYGKWKNARLREENARLREPNAYNKAKIPRSGAASPATRSNVSDDDQSIVDLPQSSQTGPRNSNYCAACRTRESRVWWKAPKGLATSILCDNCGVNWRKYADLNARPTTREDTAMSTGTSASASVSVAGPTGAKTRGAEKREGTPLTAPTAKRVKVTGSVGTKTTPPPIVPPASVQYRCVSCFRTGPHGKVLKCNECGVTLHAGACGAVLDQPDLVDSWLCELCDNEKTQEYSVNTDCLLCPRPQKNVSVDGAVNGNVNGLKGTGTAPSETYLRACKPTEGQGWVHALCAVFIPEVQFSDAPRLRIVEGVSTIPKHRWTTKCCLCNIPGGAVVRCGNCPKEYHVSCAWKYGHKFGFEIQPVKSSRRDVTSMVTFKRETGAMNAVICCKDHSSYRRDTYDICDTNDVGETALQVYARTYKQAPTQQIHSLLRKAHRLDQLLQVPHHDGSSFVSEEPTTNENPVCMACKTECSPFFHPSPADPAQWLCHRCFFSANSKEMQPQPKLETPEIIMQDA